MACSDQQGADSGLGAGGENVTVTGLISSSVDVPEGLAQTSGDLICSDENFICSVTISALDAQDSGSVLISEQFIVNLISCDFRPINGSMVKLGSFAIPADLVPNGVGIECSCIVVDASIVEEFFLNFSGDSQISLGPDGRAEAICTMSSLFDLANDAEAQAFAASVGCGALTAAQFFLELFCEGADSEDPGFICGEIASVVAETFDDLQCGGPDPECELKSCDQGCDSGTTCVQGCCQPIVAGCGDGAVTPPETCDTAGGTPLCRPPFVCASDCSGCLPPPCPRAPSPESDCDDACDNDQDGLADCDDSDCAGGPACASCGDGVVTPPEACDTRGGSPICEPPFTCKFDCSECLPPCSRSPAPETECDDGCDNDQDGLADCDDSDCAAHPDCRPPPCSVCRIPPCPPETNCSDRCDNDSDGNTDCDDADCGGSPSCGG